MAKIYASFVASALIHKMRGGGTYLRGGGGLILNFGR